VGDLAEEYGFTDVDGRTPHFSRAWERNLEAAMDAGGDVTPYERRMGPARYAMIHATPAKRDLAQRLIERHRMHSLPDGLKPVLLPLPEKVAGGSPPDEGSHQRR
jgi:hypothetical protein